MIWARSPGEKLLSFPIGYPHPAVVSWLLRTWPQEGRQVTSPQDSPTQTEPSAFSAGYPVLLRLTIKPTAIFPKSNTVMLGIIQHLLFLSELSHCFLKSSPSTWSIWLTRRKTPCNTPYIVLPFSSISFCLMYFDVLLLDTYTFRIISSWRFDAFIIM